MSLPVLDRDASLADYVVGIDIGGTKTHIRAASAGPHPSRDDRDIVVPSSTWRRGLGDVPSDAVGIRRLLLQHLGEAALRAPLALGAHGCDTTEQCDQLESELRNHFTGRVRVVNDSELMAPAMEVDDAIGVVVGTGSIATARTSQGQLLTAGGWGWLLGDEGSAPALVRDATRTVLASLDHGDSLDALGRRLMTSFSVRDGAGLALAVSQSASSDEWGARAPEIFAAADEGSNLAAQVIDTAGERLAGLVDRLLRRGVRAGAVVAGGSVIERQARLQDSLRAALSRERPSIDLVVLDRPPVTGAVTLARRLADQANHQPLRTESSTP